jgi:hypothetical protein
MERLSQRRRFPVTSTSHRGARWGRSRLRSAVSAVMLLVAAPAAASQPSPVASTFTVSSVTTTDTRTADGNTFITATRTAELTGTLTGTTFDDIEVVMHSNGTTSVRGTGTCTCTVEGRTGIFEYHFTGRGVFPASLSGRYVVHHGAGGLEGLHAQGPFSGNFLVAGVEGQYHFD